MVLQMRLACQSCCSAICLDALKVGDILILESLEALSVLVQETDRM
jgi:hypothetical protein